MQRAEALKKRNSVTTWWPFLSVRQEQSNFLHVGSVNYPIQPQRSFSFARLFGQNMAAMGLGVCVFSRAGFPETLGGRAIRFDFRHIVFLLNLNP
jgi:hypothetical protein